MQTPEKLPNSWKYRYLVFPVFFVISSLPFSVLYLISDVLYVLLRWVIKYRQTVIKQNLSNAFPQKSVKEIEILKNQFYRHLSDIIVETIKGLTISEKELVKRVQFTNSQTLNQRLNQQQSVTVVLSHSCNWEWVALVSKLYINQDVFITYKPLSSLSFEHLMYHIRSRFSGIPVRMNDTIRMVNSYNRDNRTFVLALIGDQSPSNLNGCYWGTFLNQETAFLNGTAKISQKYKLPIFYLTQKRLKRGYYELAINELSINSTDTSDEIMNACVRQMEAEIIQDPAFWLWSHRRWKHKKTETLHNN